MIQTKKISLTIVLLASAIATFGTIIDHFRGWSELINSSPDVVIARCTATPDFFAQSSDTPRFIENIGGGWTSDIDVISILKGNTKTGLSKLSSFYKPYQGELFVIFSTRILTVGTNSCYSANEDYKIIPLNSDFRINDLNGKTLDEQIQLILKSRLKDLDDEIARDNQEKVRLQEGLKAPTSTNDIITIH
jgi:hypothetical protein